MNDQHANFPHWYEYFWQNIVDSNIKNFRQNKLTIISFNYDRSLEFFFARALKAQFGLKDDGEVFEVVNTLNIIHPYGSLGSLNPNDKSNGTYLPFGNENMKLTADIINKVVTGIKIMHEGQAESKEFEQCHQALSNADMVYVMGFGFHKTNVERLRLSERFLHAKRLFASVRDKTDHEFKTNIEPILYPQFKYDRINSECLAFLRNNFYFN